MFKILSTYTIFVKKIYKMQHLEGSGTPFLYIGSTVLKGQIQNRDKRTPPLKLSGPTEYLHCHNKLI
jgi:hypothetical protein